MALVSKTGGSNPFQNVGDTVTGYVTGFPVGGKFNSTNIQMKGEDGVERVIFSAGNLKYVIADGKIELGQYTVITRIADKHSAKLGRAVVQFSVAQDPEKTIPTNDLDRTLGTTPPAALTDVSARVAALKANTAASRGKN